MSWWLAALNLHAPSLQLMGWQPPSDHRLWIIIDDTHSHLWSCPTPAECRHPPMIHFIYYPYTCKPPLCFHSAPSLPLYCVFRCGEPHVIKKQDLSAHHPLAFLQIFALSIQYTHLQSQLMHTVNIVNEYSYTSFNLYTMCISLHQVNLCIIVKNINEYSGQ